MAHTVQFLTIMSSISNFNQSFVDGEFREWCAVLTSDLKLCWPADYGSDVFDFGHALVHALVRSLVAGVVDLADEQGAVRQNGPGSDTTTLTSTHRVIT